MVNTNHLYFLLPFLEEIIEAYEPFGYKTMYPKEIRNYDSKVEDSK